MGPRPNTPGLDPTDLPGEPGPAPPSPGPSVSNPGTVLRAAGEAPHDIDADSPSGILAGPVPSSAPGQSADSFAFLSPPDRPGDLGQLGPYRVVRLLGKGGMGVVFRAEDVALHRSVALKVMLPEVATEPTARARFLREGRAAAAIKSDHVITIYQVSEANGVPYLAMEYLEGQNLEDWLKAWQQRRQAPVPVKVVIRVAKDMLRGLIAAHEKGLVHRDIKPANLWIEAGTNRVKILDFGLTRGGGAVTELTRTGQVLGTVTYMAPEQARGQKVDGRADLFSAGVVLHRMLGGQSPFKRETYNATIIAVAMDEAPSAATFGVLPAELAGLIDQLLSKNPDGRPASAKAALEVVQRVEQRLRVAAEEQSRRENERLRQAQAETDRAERMELWKRSGMPRAWVLKHLDGWGHEDWTALVSGLQSSPYWPLKAEELGNYLEALRDELRAEQLRKQRAEGERAERDREREARRLRAAEWQRREEAERLRQAQVDSDRAERMELWKRSGMPRTWVLKHLDGWGPDDWTALVSGLKSTPYWPLKAKEMGTYLETLRDELRAERDRPPWVSSLATLLRARPLAAIYEPFAAELEKCQDELHEAEVIAKWLSEPPAPIPAPVLVAVRTWVAEHPGPANQIDLHTVPVANSGVTPQLEIGRDEEVLEGLQLHGQTVAPPVIRVRSSAAARFAFKMQTGRDQVPGFGPEQLIAIARGEDPTDGQLILLIPWLARQPNEIQLAGDALLDQFGVTRVNSLIDARFFTPYRVYRKYLANPHVYSPACVRKFATGQRLLIAGSVRHTVTERIPPADFLNAEAQALRDELTGLQRVSVLSGTHQRDELVENVLARLRRTAEKFKSTSSARGKAEEFGRFFQDVLCVSIGPSDQAWPDAWRERQTAFREAGREYFHEVRLRQDLTPPTVGNSSDDVRDTKYQLIGVRRTGATGANKIVEVRVPALQSQDAGPDEWLRGTVLFQRLT